MQPSNFDYIYAALGVICGIVMIASPRTFMRKVRYDEEGVKTESLVKKLGIAVILLGVGLAIYIFTR